MSVIINDFEVAIENTPEAAGSEAAPVEVQPAAAPTPKDIRDILIRQAERMARVQAY